MQKDNKYTECNYAHVHIHLLNKLHFYCPDMVILPMLTCIC